MTRGRVEQLSHTDDEKHRSTHRFRKLYVPIPFVNVYTLRILRELYFSLRQLRFKYKLCSNTCNIVNPHKYVILPQRDIKPHKTKGYINVVT